MQRIAKIKRVKGGKRATEAHERKENGRSAEVKGKTDTAEQAQEEGYGGIQERDK